MCWTQPLRVIFFFSILWNPIYGRCVYAFDGFNSKRCISQNWATKSEKLQTINWSEKEREKKIIYSFLNDGINACVCVCAWATTESNCMWFVFISIDCCAHLVYWALYIPKNNAKMCLHDWSLARIFFHIFSWKGLLTFSAHNSVFIFIFIATYSFHLHSPYRWFNKRSSFSEKKS